MKRNFSRIARTAASAVSALALAASLLPAVPATAAASVVAPTSPSACASDAGGTFTEVTAVDFDESLLADPDELARGYVEEAFYGECASQTAPASQDSLSTLANWGASILTGDALSLYALLKDHVAAVAAEGGSSAYSVDWVSDPVEAESSAGALSAAIETLALTDVFNSLLVDCPYELYWFDKTSGLMYYFEDGTYSLELTDDGYVVTATLTFIFSVSEDYADESSAVTFSYSSGESLTIWTAVDSERAASTATAVANAQQIVVANRDETNLAARLGAYRDAICELVTYDDDAADGDDVAYGDPWQLVSVFDGDGDTNVVCEGYSKAFQYLCDLTWPDGDELACLTVTGTLSSGSSSGAHMWNLVRVGDADADDSEGGDSDGSSGDGTSALEGEGSWLVDVTNSDADAVGEDGGLFLASDENSGSVAAGYAITVSGGASSVEVSYAYDSDTTDLYGDGEDGVLALTGDEFDSTRECSATEPSLETAAVTLTESGEEVGSSTYVYDGSAKEPAVSVSYGTQTLSESTDGGETGDFTVSYADNTDAGTATVTVTAVEGSGWSGSRTVEFEIAKASQSLSFAADSIAAHLGDSSVSCDLDSSGTRGTLYYLSSDTDVATIGTTTGAITIVGAGETTITALAASTTNYRAASATCTLTVSAHEWGSASWEWDGTASATVTVTCGVDGCEVGTASATVTADDGGITGEVTTEATYASTGVMTWTATADIDGETFTSETQTEISALAMRSNTLSASGKKVTVKSRVKRGKLAKTVTVAAKRAVKVSGAVGTVTYAKKGSTGGSKISVAKNGKIKLKKGLKKRTWKVRIAVTAAGSTADGYSPATKVVTVTVKVK